MRDFFAARRLWPGLSMPRCQRKHLKTLAAPHHWMLAKTAGTFAPKPNAGPHKSRECLPIIIFLRNRLKYALNAREVTAICKRRLVRIDRKVRTNPRYPAGLMDVIELGRQETGKPNKSVERFRLLYDAKGRFVAHKIEDKEAEFKLCRVNKWFIGDKKVAQIVTHDGRTIPYAHPQVRLHDTIKLNLNTGDAESFFKFKKDSVAMVTAGRNVGRVGVIQSIEKQTAGFSIVHLVDAAGASFATRQANVFVIGDGPHPLISLPKRAGVRPTILEGLEQPAA
jgi:small subunit ribosomal protein S4e